MNLILIARSAEKLQTLSRSLEQKYHIQTRIHVLDLVGIDSVTQQLKEDDLPIGLLVYNAAFAPIGKFREMSSQDLTTVIDVNIRAPLLLSKFVSDQMIEQKRRGGIVLMSSLAGTQGSPKLTAYAASKAFNAILAEGLWSELRPHHIDVIASVAGAILTPGYQNAQGKKAPGTLTPEQVAERTLRALGKGPLIVPGMTNKIARWLMGRFLPRKTAISMMKKNTESLS
jgi:short-subunit dehydrogenase